MTTAETAVLASIVAIFVSIGACVVAAEQWRVARAKFRLDLFERRYALFELVWGFLSANVRDDEDLPAQRLNLQNHLPQIFFLFGDEMGNHVDKEVLPRAIQMEMHRRTANHPGAINPEAVQAAAMAITGLYAWFSTEASSARDRFKPFLGFEEWKADKVGG